VPPSLKYQNEGGPSVKDIANLLWDVSSEPGTDVRRFADALVFNWLIAGTDAHAKNYSLLIAPGSQVRVAPLYDLASALPYPLQISPHKAKLAMKVGSKYRLKEIARRHWEATAKELKIPTNELIDRMIALANALPAASEWVVSALHAEGLNHPTIGVLGEQLPVRAEECLRLLRV
jgi:serine/threonine-protein kinase HipA